MTDKLAKREGEELFRHGDVRDDIRAILRALGGMSEEEVQAIPEFMLHTHLSKVQSRIEHDAVARACIEDEVTAGRLSRTAADAMSADERVDYYLHSSALRHFHHAQKREVAKATPLPEVEQISRTETLSLIAQLVAVVAAQQEQLRQLRDEVAEAKNAHIAAFGKHALVDQIINAQRDIEGFEVTIELEEQASLREELEKSATEKTSSSSSNARDTHAAIDGLAKQVIGLDVGRKLNVHELETSVRSMKERGAREAQVRSRGHVHMKFGKVTGGGGGAKT